MTILIDGYNLLHAMGMPVRGIGPGVLEKGRFALLNFLVRSLEPAEAGRTVVVFDASDAPRGLPRTVKHGGITVYFAVEYESADEMIEELIRKDSVPKAMTVVSSDHRIQRAARRRKARVEESEAWYEQLERREVVRPTQTAKKSRKPKGPLDEGEIDRWIESFGGEDDLRALVDRVSSESNQSKEPPPESDMSVDVPGDEELPELENPFPPGYGEDLSEEDF